MEKNIQITTYDGSFIPCPFVGWTVRNFDELEQLIIKYCFQPSGKTDEAGRPLGYYPAYGIACRNGYKLVTCGTRLYFKEDPDFADKKKKHRWGLMKDDRLIKFVDIRKPEEYWDLLYDQKEMDKKIKNITRMVMLCNGITIKVSE